MTDPDKLVCQILRDQYGNKNETWSIGEVCKKKCIIFLEGITKYERDILDRDKI